MFDDLMRKFVKWLDPKLDKFSSAKPPLSHQNTPLKLLKNLSTFSAVRLNLF